MAKVGDSIKIGRSTVSNRLMVAPMTTSFADTMGYPSEGAYLYYEELAKGGWGFIQIEGHAVKWPYGAMNQVQARLDDDSYIPGVTRIVEVIHKYGIPCTVQLMYGGAVAQRWLPRIGFTAFGPSAEYKPYGGLFGQIKEFTTAQCEELIGSWVAAALRAKKAGADGICIHGSTGNIPQQFMSPMSNHRKDKYGDRLAFATELVTKIRDAVGPDFLIIYRIASDELIGEAGITVDWTAKEAIPTLEKAGKIDAWDINPGFMGGPLNGLSPLVYFPRGVNLPYVLPLREATSKPLIHAGKINDGRLAVGLLEEEKVDIVSLGRGALADHQFANKVLRGEYDEIRQCNACGTSCLARDPMRPISCALNATFGSSEEAQLRPAEKKKKVIVVGGGVGGMEAARVAKKRGHDVTLFEKEPELGGQTRLASQTPNLGLEEFSVIVDWLSRQLGKLNVKIELNKEVDADMITNLNPDVVVVTTGSRPAVLDVPGADGTNCGTLDDYLGKKFLPGKKVAVIGGGYGVECAISLARGGKEVTVVEEGPKEATGVTPYMPLFGARYLYCAQNMGKEGVKSLAQVKVKEITDKGVRYQDEKGEEHLLECDSVVFTLSRVPNADLVDKLKGKVPEVFVIGDAEKPSRFHDAIHPAFALGNKI